LNVFSILEIHILMYGKVLPSWQNKWRSEAFSTVCWISD